MCIRDSLGSLSTPIGAVLEYPVPNTHKTSIGTVLRYRVDRPNLLLLTFNPGLANAGGVPVKKQNGANAQLRITLQNEGTTDQPNWVAHWSKEYGGDL